MKLAIEPTLTQYAALYDLPERKREDYFRYTMMKHFEPMWNLIGVPLKAGQPGGYDVLTASGMLGYLSVRETETGLEALEMLRQAKAEETALSALRRCVSFAEQAELRVRADELRFGLYLADPLKLELRGGTCGFGGIPGYIQVMLYPTERNLPRLPAVIAHEFHHNLRFSYFGWDHGNVTLGDYLVIEGLAESFARELFGDERLGPWVNSMEPDDFEYLLHVFKDALALKGFAEVSSYMFGDLYAREQGYAPAGVSPFAGYSVGYAAVQAFLGANDVTIGEATLLSTEEILGSCGLF
ncbi:DUF2268 domain-containing protein [Paenibacillus chitinolyticus]|uniref:DUF2268 domain-containing protein n=1 Tax=Paenibacillus chitinolyticus TaxID=79263 RepID=UPI0036DEE7A5